MKRAEGQDDPERETLCEVVRLSERCAGGNAVASGCLEGRIHRQNARSAL
jgi:hypothetical protein